MNFFVALIIFSPMVHGMDKKNNITNNITFISNAGSKFTIIAKKDIPTSSLNHAVFVAHFSDNQQNQTILHDKTGTHKHYFTRSQTPIPSNHAPANKMRNAISQGCEQYDNDLNNMALQETTTLYQSTSVKYWFFDEASTKIFLNLLPPAAQPILQSSNNNSKKSNTLLPTIFNNLKKHRYTIGGGASIIAILLITAGYFKFWST